MRDLVSLDILEVYHEILSCGIMRDFISHEILRVYHEILFCGILRDLVSLDIPEVYHEILKVSQNRRKPQNVYFLILIQNTIIELEQLLL